MLNDVVDNDQTFLPATTQRWEVESPAALPVRLQTLDLARHVAIAPDGKRYDKAQALDNESSVSERDCRLDEAKVRLFGGDVALAFGSERAVRKPKDSKEFMRCLVWTDTWLKRENKWQIVSAQDTQVPCQ